METLEFLEDLTNGNYVAPLTKENLKLIAKTAKDQAVADVKQAKQFVKDQKTQEKEAKKNGVPKDDENNSLFGATGGTEILGRDRIILIKKIQQHKTLFPEILKTFKVKKNASVEELQNTLLEVQTLVEVSSVDGFVLDSILSIVKMTEGLTSTTQYDISGLSDLLKLNKEFTNLAKVLFIKYNVFASVPPEYQMMMIVVTTSYLCIQKNKSKGAINSFLNEPIKV